MQALIGVDIGTQGVKAGLFNGNGRTMASAFRASQLHRPQPGIVEENPEYQFTSVCAVIRECIDAAQIAPSDVAAIAIAGQMAGIIGIGADGRNITPYDSWLDTRCADMARHMTNLAGQEIIRKTCGFPSINHGPKMLWWKQQHPDVFKSIASFVQPGGYVAMRLCGLKAEQAFIDATYLHFSGFADTAGAKWDAALCRTFDVDVKKLPRIVESHERIGGLTREKAVECGLLAGTPVIAGCGDTAASFLAAGATEPGIGVDVAGTASVFAGTLPHALADLTHGTVGCGRSAVSGLWHPYAYISGGGMNLQWFSQCLCTDPHTTLAQWDAMAKSVWDEQDLPMFCPHLSGRVCPCQPHQRGAWVGLQPHHGAGHLYYAVLESVAMEYAGYLDVIRRLAPDHALRQLRVVGGGQCSDVWNQIKADVLGVPVVRITNSEGAPRGAAMLAARGVGLIGDLHQAAQTWIKRGSATQPGPQRIGRVARRKLTYAKLLDLLNDWSCS